MQDVIPVEIKSNELIQNLEPLLIEKAEGYETFVNEMFNEYGKSIEEFVVETSKAYTCDVINVWNKALKTPDKFIEQYEKWLEAKTRPDSASKKSMDPEN